MSARRSPTPETREKMSLAKLGDKNPMFGSVSPMRGRKHRPESVERIRANNIGRSNPMFGKRHKKVTLLKIQARAKERVLYGPANPQWKGGRFISSSGYALIKLPEHPYANISGYVYEHRLIAEKALGRYLKPTEIVHHFNGKHADNRNENLVICEDSKYHNLIEARTRKSKKEGVCYG